MDKRLKNKYFYGLLNENSLDYIPDLNIQFPAIQISTPDIKPYKFFGIKIKDFKHLHHLLKIFSIEESIFIGILNEGKEVTESINYKKYIKLLTTKRILH